MSVTKNPAIAALDPASLCHSIYIELYNQFFNAQDKKDVEHPYGIEEGDDTSIRLHNTAYGFAYAIAGAVEGGGSGNQGGILLDYLQKAGGDMSGMLRANYGFEAGIGNHRVVELFSEDGEQGARIHGTLDLFGEGITLAGRPFLSFIYETGTVFLDSRTIDFGTSSIVSSGELIFGSRDEGVLVTSENMLISGKPVYHAGNANLSSVDWTMRDAFVAGDIQVEGSAVLSGYLKALNGAEIGANGKALMRWMDDEMFATGFLSFAPDYGIKINDCLVLGRAGTSDIVIGGIGGDLLLGSGSTNKIKLISGIMDTDADYMLLSPYGAAYFPDSLTVRHNYGEVVLSSYRMDSDDEGIVVHKRLRFGDSRGAYLHTAANGLALHSFFDYTDPDNAVTHKIELNTVIRYGISTSLFSPQDRTVGSLLIETGADTVLFDKPVETKSYFSVNGTLTRLAGGALYLGNDIYLLGVSDGIKHYGNAYMLGDISSEYFSSGFAGSGWAIAKNKSTGNVVATVDELTVRKRMRVYELEVQKTSVTNGSLWISHSCSGDTVERVY